eukprot:2887129-Alexandrium_andersonii.AAC.1
MHTIRRSTYTVTWPSGQSELGTPPELPPSPQTNTNTSIIKSNISANKSAQRPPRGLRESTP